MISNCMHAFHNKGLFTPLALALLFVGCATAPYMKHYDRGMEYIKASKINPAENEFRKAVRRKPDFAEGHYRLGEVLLSQHQIEEAIGEFRKAVRLKPDLALNLYLLAVILDKDGRKREAREFWVDILRVEQDPWRILIIKQRLAEPDS